MMNLLLDIAPNGCGCLDVCLEGALVDLRREGAQDEADRIEAGDRRSVRSCA